MVLPLKFLMEWVLLVSNLAGFNIGNVSGHKIGDRRT